MNILLLNQCFYPDVAATGQYLTDLAQGLSERGHNVTVITSNRGYDDPTRQFASRETWRGIRIIRIRSLHFGKEARWRRAVNFATYLFSCALRLLLLPRFDAVLALTSPPLISFLGALFVQLRGGKLFFWVMDLNPDEAVVAGWIKESSMAARFLKFCLQYSLRVAETIVVLDRFMKERIVDKGIPDEQVAVVPPWPLSAVRYDEPGRQAFRDRHNLSQKFVVMYAGNHSPCHPLGTLLEAAQKMAPREDVVFYFVGGGSEQRKIRSFAAEQHLHNVVCLPYQPLDELAGVLSAADLHAVVMGEDFVGIIHPCKIYNVLAVGSPFVYVGPEDSHIADIARKFKGEDSSYMASHGSVESVVKHIEHSLARRAAQGASHGRSQGREWENGLSRELLLPMMIDIVERATITPTVTTAAVSESSI